MKQNKAQFKEQPQKIKNAAQPVHSGHRDRIKNRFLKDGLENFEPHAVLELLLFYGIPLKDTNPIGHALLQKFGSLSGVFDAPYEELIKVEGVGKSAATLIKLIPEICRRYQENLDKDKNVIFSYNEAGRHLIHKFIGRSDEVIVLMLLDSKNRMIYCGVVNEGTVTTANIYIKKIVKLAVQYNAVYAILSHNHPSGDCMPSKQDISSTQWVYEALNIVEIKLIDHIIVSGNDYFSIAKSGIMPEIFDVGFDTE
ncbi:JAB domain-containing protein [Caproiciproducens faecalis]|uniref:JAB domain-containing protein n=1 Tax=Caproiciproducens faecalis TaxID=2820301 RepID=UPI0021029070|nr:DNA repair protein RadC [Caproiciproducens faecalis]